MPTIELPVIDTFEPATVAITVPPPPPVRARILSVSPVVEDHAELHSIIDESAWELVPACSLDSALRRLERHRAHLVICERALPDGSWRDLLQHTTADSCLVVVSSRLADEYLWTEVLNLGGFDVLAKPFNEQEVLHVLASARGHGGDTFSRYQSVGTM